MKRKLHFSSASVCLLLDCHSRDGQGREPWLQPSPRRSAWCWFIALSPWKLHYLHAGFISRCKNSEGALCPAGTLRERSEFYISIQLGISALWFWICKKFWHTFGEKQNVVKFISDERHVRQTDNPGESLRSVDLSPMITLTMTRYGNNKQSSKIHWNSNMDFLGLKPKTL